MSALGKMVPLREQLATAAGQVAFEKSLQDPVFVEQVQNLYRNPDWALRNLIAVQDQEQNTITSYDPDTVTHNLQQDMIQYWTSPPRTPDGYAKWYVSLASRQTGKSTVPEVLGTHSAMINPGWDHVCDADTDKRASYLHQRAQIAYAGCPAYFRPMQVTNKESRQLTLRHGQTTSRLRTRTASAEATGIGETPSSYHGSEMGFWPNFAKSWTLISPSLRNSRNARVIMECTPVPPSMASGEQWREFCQAARTSGPDDRLIYRFFPYWDSKLNARSWGNTWALEPNEIERLNRWGPYGMTRANLAFRREILKTDEEIRKDPKLFDLWYPSDDISCWITSGGGVIPANCLERHINFEETVPWDAAGTYMEYHPPRPGALYCIGSDPSGFAARDHSSFQVLEVWRGKWRQVATFAGHVDPILTTQKLVEVGLRYNRALIGVESNGVGQGVLTALVQANYPNIYFQGLNNPGLSTTGASQQGHLADLTTALLDTLVLHDKDTIEQLATYKGDKLFQTAVSTETMRNATQIFSESGTGRRAKHHWDKVSALIVAVQMAKQMPQHFEPSSDSELPAYLREGLRAGRRIDHENPSLDDEIAKLSPQERAVWDKLVARSRGNSSAWGSGSSKVSAW